MRSIIPCIFLVLFLAACTPDALHGSVVKDTSPEDALVVRVIDGDTLVLDDERKVRLVCINTPELGDPFSEEARLFLENAVLGKEVVLEKDEFDKDRFGRSLRYVWLDRLMVNEDIVLNGLGKVERHPPNLKYCDDLAFAESFAKQERLGVWSLDNP